MFKIRSSKYRHVYCDPPKPEQIHTGFRLSTVTGDQQYIKASARYYVVALSGGGGPMHVGRLDRPGRFEVGTSQQVEGHTGAILDFDFNPFDDSMFASASEDCTIKLWSIPEDWEPTDTKGIAKSGKNSTESIVDLTAHKKRVTLLNFHPSAANVLGSTSADCTVKVWDVEMAEEISSFNDFNDMIQDIIWDLRGDAIATSCKDKMIRYLDPRSGKVSSVIQTPHDGLKTVKLAYLGDSGKFLTTGASRNNAREVKIWDLKNLSSPLSTEAIDTASGALLPLFDADTNLLFLCGKGDGIIRPYEFENAEPFLHKMNDGFRSTVPAKGLCLVPKRGLNVMDCETARILKLTNNEGVHPLSWTVPRKADGFQDDLFPDCAAPSPAHTAAEWAAGSSKAPLTMSLNPAMRNGSNGTKKTMLKSASSIAADLDKAQDRIKYLEHLLKYHGIQY